MKERVARPKNLLFAFAVAPLSGAFAVAAIVLIFGVLLARWGRGAGGVAATLFVLVSILGYAVEIVAGVPCYFLFRRLGWIMHNYWIAFGAILGTVTAAIWPICVLVLNPEVAYGAAAVAVSSTVGLVWGAASGAAFAWIIKVDPRRSTESQ
jgi:hypothetical protein